MKIAVQCESPLLQKSLELLLNDSLCSLKQCDIVLSDKKALSVDKPMLWVSQESGANIVKPFSKESLHNALKQYFSTRHQQSSSSNEKEARFFELVDKIEKLTDTYKINMIKLIREHYEK